MYRKVTRYAVAASLSLLVVRIATADLAITHPTSGQQIYIGSAFNVAGTGASYGMPPNQVVIKGWRSPGLIGVEPPNFSFATFPSSNGTFQTSGLTYTDAESSNGIITAEQNGNPPSADVTVDWLQQPE